MAKRYTAIVEIVEVEETPETRSGYNNQTVTPAKTDKRELTKFVIRDEDLATLKVKLGKHVELV